MLKMKSNNFICFVKQRKIRVCLTLLSNREKCTLPMDYQAIHRKQIRNSKYCFSLIWYVVFSIIIPGHRESSLLHLNYQSNEKRMKMSSTITLPANCTPSPFQGRSFLTHPLHSPAGMTHTLHSNLLNQSNVENQQHPQNTDLSSR